jgi:hypothetical protein
MRPISPGRCDRKARSVDDFMSKEDLQIEMKRLCLVKEHPVRIEELAKAPDISRWELSCSP